MLRTLKQSRFWSVLVTLLMAAQLGLAFHSLEHTFDSGLPANDHCALCQVASTMASGPAAEPIAAPSLYAFVTVAAVITPLLRTSASPAGFRSRAPPVIVSL
jgi:hypothetical protein